MGGAVRKLPVVLVLLALGSAAPAEAQPPPEVPEPAYQSVEQEITIPMDDGVELAATLAFPSHDGQKPAPGRFPAVLGMTPYGRNGVCGCFPPELFAEHGMVGAVVDVRGTGGSGGSLEDNYFSPREARDGYAVIEYLGTRSWSSGRVGMAGGSYVGITQYLAAALRPPHLAAITPALALSDLYRDAYTHGGIPNFFFDSQYLAVQGVPGLLGTNTDPALAQHTLEAKVEQAQTPSALLAFDYLSRPTDDPFYRERSPIYGADRIEVPALVIGGWRDGFIRGTVEMYRALARREGVETRLYVNPCTHKGCGPPFDPTENPTGVEPLNAVVLEFLRRHLLDADTAERPPVRYYLQNAGGYADAGAWPPTGTSFKRFNLAPGELSPAGPPGERGSQSYFTNPLAGLSMALDRHGTVAASPYVPTDQRLEEPQGLTFRTQPVAEPLRLAGPIQLHLVASSTAADTDWYAKLADVAPDGSQAIITDGMLRASHRELDEERSSEASPYHVHEDPRPNEPGRRYAYDISIWPTAYELAPGHRLQLRITSNDAPTHLDAHVRVDRDDPGATRIEPLPPATNTVHLGRGGSWLLIPVAGDAG